MSPEARALAWRATLAILASGALVALGIASATWSVALIGPVVVLGVLAFALRRPLRAYRAARAPVDPAVMDLLQRHVRHLEGLAAPQREAFARRVMRLLATLDFECVGGAEDTLELRVLAVAGAALLYVGRSDLHIDEHRSVVFYPDAFSEEYAVQHDARIAGMVHRQGPVLFSERALRDGWNRSTDGYNVSIHEWAHVLDLEDGFADGIPGLAAGSLDDEQELLSRELLRARGGRSALREYAGTNRAELFAVATEVFFERPDLLRRSHSQLYDVLRSWLRVSPDQLLAVAVPHQASDPPRTPRGKPAKQTKRAKQARRAKKRRS